MKLLSTTALAATFLLGAADATDFDFFDFEGWYEGGLGAVAAEGRPAGSTPALNMLLTCEEGDGFNGNNCELVIRGPDGFSICGLVDPPANPPGVGTIFTGKIAKNQFDADTGVADFYLTGIVCYGVPLTTLPLGPPGSGGVPFEPTPVSLEMTPGASNKHIKSLKFTIVGQQGSDVSNFYKLGGGMK
uniref:Uncharacterized protein n=1 Tax=Minutocellus polymorphus TaxID=265543 RepID=A0A7S0FUV9_9STRA